MGFPANIFDANGTAKRRTGRKGKRLEKLIMANQYGVSLINVPQAARRIPGKGPGGAWVIPSDETRRKISQNHIGFRGRVHSEETRRKMSASNKERWRIRKMSGGKE